MMEAFWTSFAEAPPLISYIGLFLLAFLSASLLPMGSVWFMLLLLARGDPQWMVWLVATAGNSLGAVLNYWLGFYASQWVRKKQTPERWQKSEAWFQKYGIWSMLLSWLPIIGDPLTLVAGVLRANFYFFLILMTLGKALRYAVVVLGFDYVAH